MMPFMSAIFTKIRDNNQVAFTMQNQRSDDGLNQLSIAKL